MNKVSTFAELEKLPENAVIKYPCHADDYGEIMTASVLLKLKKKYPEKFDEEKAIEDLKNGDPELGAIITEFDKFAATFDEDIRWIVNEELFVPALSTQSEELDYDDDGIVEKKFKQFVESKGWKLYYCPYGSMLYELHKWWAFD